ncbi:glycosyltransferase family 2 protein [Fibrobacter sp. UWB12]|uniref:glycosyltransferase family 2 protein n=1 Tax=Fibrobacter sp. UWB12 TaxID=1896203 RepID=UPI000921BC71|nr:glycosyltransferase family 2 protein [Fibrobacter sp. UWB12]SHK38217.1 Glycosyltransferase involved in cell wall bisynthesis [Fibrobacter sp. UWB12]
MSCPAIDYFIFVPAYNVEKTLGEVLSKIEESVLARAHVLVIDDGSRDGTAQAFERFMSICVENAECAENARDFKSHFEYLKFEQNSGYGAVVKKGIAEGLASGAAFIACLHGDGQYPAEKLGEFFAEMENCNLDLLQGSRHAVAGEAKRGGMPLYKRIGGAFLTALENLTFRVKLTDRHSGFIVYSSRFLKTVDLNRLSPSFDIDLELIAIADARRFAIAELPIPTRYADEKSNLNVVSYGLRVLRQIWRRMLASKH